MWSKNFQKFCLYNLIFFLLKSKRTQVYCSNSDRRVWRRHCFRRDDDQSGHVPTEIQMSAGTTSTDLILWPCSPSWLTPCVPDTWRGAVGPSLFHLFGWRQLRSGAETRRRSTNPGRKKPSRLRINLAAHQLTFARLSDSPRSQPVWAVTFLHPPRSPYWRRRDEPVPQPWGADFGLWRPCRAAIGDEGPSCPPGQTSRARPPPPALLRHSSTRTPRTLRADEVFMYTSTQQATTRTRVKVKMKEWKSPKQILLKYIIFTVLLIFKVIFWQLIYLDIEQMYSDTFDRYTHPQPPIQTPGCLYCRLCCRPTHCRCSDLPDPQMPQHISVKGSGLFNPEHNINTAIINDYLIQNSQPSEP